MQHQPSNSIAALVATLSLCASPWVCAQDVAQDVAQDIATQKALQAIVIDVSGKARWRPSADASWRDAKVNDIVDPGTEIRTGLRSRLTMRVGKNATVLVDSGTTFELPEIMQDGESLRTTASVRSGRVDFKVDKIGFANDFKVITPQTTLSVRGTGFSLATGPLQGFEVTGARTNAMHAIELNYAANNRNYFVSQQGQSSSSEQDPVKTAWISTIGPPPMVGLLVSNNQLMQQVAQGQVGNSPLNPQQIQQQNAAESNGVNGNALVDASNQEGASDEAGQLASSVVTTANGSTPAIPKPKDSETPGARNIRNELVYVRGEVAKTEVERIAAQTQHALALDASRLAVNEDERLNGDGWRSILSDAMEDPTTISRARAVIDIAQNPLQGDVRALVSKIDLNSVDVLGHAIFSTRPESETSFLLGALDMIHTSSGGSAVDFGALNALRNASEWSAVDATRSLNLKNSIEETVVTRPDDARSHHADLAKIDAVWNGDRNTPDSQAATGVAVMLDASMQRSWDEVMKQALRSDGTNLLRAVQATVDAAEKINQSGHSFRRNEGDSKGNIANYVAYFNARIATQDATLGPAAATEVARLAEQANADAMLMTAASDQAWDAAHTARSLGQRRFQEAASASLLSYAAGIVLESHEKLTTIITNSRSIVNNFTDGTKIMRDAGFIAAPTTRP